MLFFSPQKCLGGIYLSSNSSSSGSGRSRSRVAIVAEVVKVLVEVVLVAVVVVVEGGIPGSSPQTVCKYLHDSPPAFSWKPFQRFEENLIIAIKA